MSVTHYEESKFILAIMCQLLLEFNFLVLLGCGTYKASAEIYAAITTRASINIISLSNLLSVYPHSNAAQTPG
jgi:hypothetical protein